MSDPVTITRLMALLLALLMFLPQEVGGRPNPVPANARSWEQFLQGARTQRELWLKTDARVAIPPALVERVERARRGLQLVVVAEDWCPDSAYTVPYVARLATLARVPLSIVERTSGDALMRAHPAWDGRTVDADDCPVPRWRDVGAWVERPAALQDLFRSIGDSPANASRFAERGAWYEADNGMTALGEIVTLIEQTGAHR